MEIDSLEEVPKVKSLVPVVVSSVLISALIAGGGIYVYLKSISDKNQTDLQNQINILKAQVSASNAVTTTPTATATATPTASAQATANWKTYTSNTYGLTIKYPNDWVTLDYSLYNKASIIGLASPTSAAYLVNTQGKADDSSSLLYYLKTEKSKDQGNSNVQDYAAIKIGQYDGYKVQQPNIGGVVFYYIEHSGHVYIFELESGTTEVVTQILATLTLN
jgi:hypothetical protein